MNIGQYYSCYTVQIWILDNITVGYTVNIWILDNTSVGYTVYIYKYWTILHLVIGKYMNIGQYYSWLYSKI
jgi:hypothetical protein